MSRCCKTASHLSVGYSVTKHAQHCRPLELFWEDLFQSEAQQDMQLGSQEVQVVPRDAIAANPALCCEVQLKQGMRIWLALLVVLHYRLWNTAFARPQSLWMAGSIEWRG